MLQAQFYDTEKAENTLAKICDALDNAVGAFYNKEDEDRKMYYCLGAESTLLVTYNPVRILSKRIKLYFGAAL